MMDFIEILPELNGQLLWEHIRSIGIAYLLSLPIAFNREIDSRSAGIRTFPLVSVACCGYTLLAILKTDDHVSGLATASSIWVTGAIGMAVAWKRYEIAVLLSLITFLTLYLSNRTKKVVKTIYKK